MGGFECIFDLFEYTGILMSFLLSCHGTTDNRAFPIREVVGADSMSDVWIYQMFVTLGNSINILSVSLRQRGCSVE